MNQNKDFNISFRISWNYLRLTLVEMDPSKLTNYQLYEINLNSRIDKGIRNLVCEELNSRKLTNEEIRQLAFYHDEKFKPLPNVPLALKYRILLVLFPFVIPVPIQAIIAVKYLIRGQKRKWNDYWLSISLGYLLWTIGIIIFCRLFLFNPYIN